MAQSMGITVKETLEPMYMGGNGGQVVVVIGNAGWAKELSKVYTFNSIDVAKLDHSVYPNSLGPTYPATAYSPLLSAVRDVFAEGAVSDQSQNGIWKVYAINVGPTPNIADYTSACLLAETLQDAVIEYYVGLSDVTIFPTLAAAQVTMAGTGGYRHAVGVGPGTAYTPGAGSAVSALATAIIALNPVSVQQSRFLIVADPNMAAAYVAKQACTDPSVDPAFGPYRSKNATNIIPWTAQDIAALYTAGIIVDIPAISNSGLAEPYMAVSTSWALATAPNDSLVHCRRGADSFWRITDLIAKGLLKSNDIQVARGMAQQVGIGVLKQGVEDGKIVPNTGLIPDDGFLYTVSADPVNLFTLIINRKIRPVGSAYFIVENSIIQSPLAGV